MTNDPQEELISAYLDGELSADEQRRVERLLTESAEYRQFYDELRALHNSIESLPRYRLPDDLSQRVLRRAEQELLRDRAETQAASNSAASTTSSSANASEVAANGDAVDMHVVRAPETDRPSYHPRGWRAVFWPVMVVAAALLMMFFGPKARDGQREIARAPAEGERLAKVPAGSNEAKSNDAKLQPPAEMGAAPDDATASDFAGSDLKASETYRKRVAASSLVQDSDGKSAGEKRDAAADSRQEGRRAEDATQSALGVQKQESSDIAERQLRKSSRASDAQGAVDAEMDAIHAGELAAEGAPADGSLGDRQELSKVQQRRGAIAAAEKPAAQDEKAPAGEPQTNGISDSPTAQTAGPLGRALRGAGNIPVPGPAPMADADFDPGDLFASHAPAVDDTYVIEVNLTPAAARDHAFEKLLARHQLVAYSAPPAQAQPAQVPMARSPVPGPDDASADIADSDDANSGKKDTVPAGSPPPVEKKKQLAAELAEVEGEYAAPFGDGVLPALREVEVNATADQFVATLRDLREHSDQFAEARLEFGAVRELARQLPAEQLMFDRSAAKDVDGRGIAGAEEATSAPATPMAVPPAAALPAAVTPAIRAKGQAQQQAEPKSTDGLDRQPGGVALKKARQQQSKAQSKQTESLADEPTRPAADKENAAAKREVGDRDAAGVDTKPADAKDHVAKNGTIAGEAGKADEDKAEADVVGGDKPQLRADGEKLSEKGQRAKGSPAKPGSSKPKAGAAKTAPPKPGDGTLGQADTAVLGGAQPAAAGGPGGVQLHSQKGGLQLNLAPAKAEGRSAQGINQTAGAPGGGGGGIGGAPAAPGAAAPTSPAAPVSAGFGSAGSNGAKTAESAPVRPAATVNNRLTRQASPTVKLIFRLHVAEPAVAAPIVAEPAAPEPAAAEPAAKEGAMSDVRIRLRPSGPLVIEGPFTLVDEHGNAFPLPTDKPLVALCRCGHSAKKPFCDGSHKACGFQAVELAPTAAGQ